MGPSGASVCGVIVILGSQGHGAAIITILSGGVDCACPEAGKEYARTVPGRLSVGPMWLRQSDLLPSTSSVFDCGTNIVADGYGHLGAVDDSRAKGQRAQVY